MKRAAFFLLGFITLLIIVTAFRSYSWRQSNLRYVSQQVGSEANWNDVWLTFLEHFEVGMTRDEVIDTLTKLDPDLSRESLKDNYISCTELRCCESITPFRNHMGQAYSFCYDGDAEMKLRSVKIRS